MDFPHNRANETLYVSTIMWGARGAVSKFNSMLPAPTLKSLTVKLFRVVEVECLGNAMDRPRPVDFHEAKIIGFWEYGMGDGECQGIRRMPGACRRIRPPPKETYGKFPWKCSLGRKCSETS